MYVNAYCSIPSIFFLSCILVTNEINRNSIALCAFVADLYCTVVIKMSCHQFEVRMWMRWVVYCSFWWCVNCEHIFYFSFPHNNLIWAIKKEQIESSSRSIYNNLCKSETELKGSQINLRKIQRVICSGLIVVVVSKERKYKTTIKKRKRKFHIKKQCRISMTILLANQPSIIRLP